MLCHFNLKEKKYTSKLKNVYTLWYTEFWHRLHWFEAEMGGGSFLFLLRLFHTGMQHNCMIQVFRVRNSTFEELSCAWIKRYDLYVSQTRTADHSDTVEHMNWWNKAWLCQLKSLTRISYLNKIILYSYSDLYLIIIWNKSTN